VNPAFPRQVSRVESPGYDEFVKTILRSGLFAAPEFASIRQSVPADVAADPTSLANYLVRIGKLSRFQASKLLEGVTLGLVLGAYHVLAPIGKGGMGAVYLARDSRTGGLVALKVLPPKRAKSRERLLMRFRREMEISQRVVHPHITRTMEAGVHLGINYIAMEFIPGKNLYKLIHEHGPLKVPRAARMFAEAALGLSHAHGLGLIHRDLKPSNIMVMPNDHVKVLDLGLALMQGEGEADKTMSPGQGHIVGTLDYLAPEQADDPLKVDARSDIYSLGCALYFALTGSPPFAGGNALQKMLRHRLDAPRPIIEVNPSVPASFAVLLTRMIAKKPEMRFQSAMEVFEAVLPWTGDVPGMPAPGMAAKAGDMAPVALPGNGQSEGPAPVAIPMALPVTSKPAPAPEKPPAPQGLPPAPLSKPSASATMKMPVPASLVQAAAATAKLSVPAQPAAPAPPPAAPSPPTPAAKAAPPPSTPKPPEAPAKLPESPAKPQVAPSPPAASPKPLAPQPKPAPPEPAPISKPVPAVQKVAAPEPATIPKPPVAPPKPAPPPLEPAAKSAPLPVVPAPEQKPAVAEAAPVKPPTDKPPPMAEEPAPALPFWLDFAVPVGSSALFLLVLWVAVVILLWQM
jgi:eukaryotic-like serine/threonine-protein kinase